MSMLLRYLSRNIENLQKDIKLKTLSLRYIEGFWTRGNHLNNFVYLYWNCLVSRLCALFWTCHIKILLYYCVVLPLYSIGSSHHLHYIAACIWLHNGEKLCYVFLALPHPLLWWTDARDQSAAMNWHQCQPSNLQCLPHNWVCYSLGRDMRNTGTKHLCFHPRLQNSPYREVFHNLKDKLFTDVTITIGIVREVMEGKI